MYNVLVLDDETSILTALKYALEDNYNVFTTPKVEEALEIIANNNIDLVLLDQFLGDGYFGLDVLSTIKSYDHRILVIAMTAYGSIENSIEAIQRGAYYYITKPLNFKALLELMDKALDYQSLSDKVELLENQINDEKNRMVSSSSKSMKEVMDMVDRVKDLDINILITGESGTGKELIARTIHNSSKRKDNPLEIINCAAIPHNLLESELFGYEKGAFTGANAKYRGKFELANSGTIFLDEIGDLDISLQAKLLRVIQEKKITPLGSEKSISVDFRLLTATNKDLSVEVKNGNFREDLYFRLNVINIVSPPLRERKEDIPSLTKHFIDKYNTIFNKNIAGISKSAISVLEQYDYPGNVRELENIIERSVALSGESSIDVYDLPKELLDNIDVEKTDSPVEITVGDTIESAEKKLILATLEYCKYNKRQTAKMLDMSERNLYNKLNKYKIDI